MDTKATPIGSATAARRVSMLETALKPIAAYLNDTTVVEIMLNPDGTLWIERAGEGMSQSPVALSLSDAERAIRLIATAMGETIDSRNPSIAGTLPKWGCRVQASLPPIVTGPAFTLRKPASLVYTLEDYTRAGIMTQAEADTLKNAVLDHQNIIVSGGTGSGKTTLTNALLNVVAETQDRVYLVEDTRELQCAANNKMDVFTTADYPMKRAIIDALRHRPDRIIIGEVRDGAALDMLKAWNTGHPGGIATVHANNPRQTLNRLCQLIEENNMAAPRDFVAEAIDLCVHIARDPAHAAGRRLTGIVSVDGLDESGDWLLKTA